MNAIEMELCDIVLIRREWEAYNRKVRPLHSQRLPNPHIPDFRTFTATVKSPENPDLDNDPRTLDHLAEWQIEIASFNLKYFQHCRLYRKAATTLIF